MLTKDDLQAIGELIQASEGRIRKDIVTKRDLELNNTVLSTIFKVELATTKQEIVEAVKAGFQEVVKHEVKTEQETAERVTSLEKRLDKLEKQVKFLAPPPPRTEP